MKILGLKPTQSNIPIKPAVVTNNPKNALDTLDSTLSNLASSLGGQQSWGMNKVIFHYKTFVLDQLLGI